MQQTALDESLIPEISFWKKIVFMLVNCTLLLFRCFKVNEKKVVYWSKSLQFEGNAKALYLEWLTEKDFEHVWLMNRKDGVKTLPYPNTAIAYLTGFNVFYHLYTAKFWIREADLSSPGILPRKETVVVQLWHAAGAFKKFGLDLKNRGRDLQRYRWRDAQRWDLTLCSSEKVKGIFKQAFGGLDEKKMFVCGLPRNDFLYELTDNVKQNRQTLNIPANKKLLLYAPTFRDNGLNQSLFSDVVNFLNTHLPDDYLLGVRLHPVIAKKIQFGHGVLDLSGYETEFVLSISDLLLTDYSSIVFDFALLERPMLFFAPDKDVYLNTRGCYFEYDSFVPGPVCTTFNQLISVINTLDEMEWLNAVKNFKKDFQPEFDGKNSYRVLKKIMNAI